jgi:hypothetical protein
MAALSVAGAFPITESLMLENSFDSTKTLIDKCDQFRIQLAMVRWKRFGVIVVQYSTDHDPRHVHVFQDRERILKFDIENWTVMEGKMTPKARRALESLRQEGIFDEKS